MNLDDFDFEACYEYIKEHINRSSHVSTISVCGLIGKFLDETVSEVSIRETLDNRKKIFKIIAPTFGWPANAEDIYLMDISKPAKHIKIDFDIFKEEWKND